MSPVECFESSLDAGLGGTRCGSGHQYVGCHEGRGGVYGRVPALQPWILQKVAHLQPLLRIHRQQTCEKLRSCSQGRWIIHLEIKFTVNQRPLLWVSLAYTQVFSGQKQAHPLVWDMFKLSIRAKSWVSTNTLIKMEKIPSSSLDCQRFFRAYTFAKLGMCGYVKLPLVRDLACSETGSQAGSLKLNSPPLMRDMMAAALSSLDLAWNGARPLSIVYWNKTNLNKYLGTNNYRYHSSGYFTLYFILKWQSILYLFSSKIKLSYLPTE